jgi:hypothetical protein
MIAKLAFHEMLPQPVHHLLDGGSLHLAKILSSQTMDKVANTFRKLNQARHARA